MSKPVHADDGTYCPLWRKPRCKVCHTCAWWNLVQGKHPQTGQDVNRWDCAIAFMPMLQIEATQAHRQTTATVDQLRKEVAESHDVAMVGAIHKLNMRVPTELPMLPAEQPKLIGN